MIKKYEIKLYGKTIGYVDKHGNFRYLDNYSGPLLSISTPIGKKTNIKNFLEHLLPDNFKKLKKFAEKLNCDPYDILEMTARIGFDLPGAIEIYHYDKPKALEHKNHDILTEEDIETLLEELDPREINYSVSGFQNKIALLKANNQWYKADGRLPTTHIIKPSMKDHSDQYLVELFSQQVAQKCGFDIPETTIEKFGNVHTIISKRYDRTDDQKRIHQEDLAQALNIKSDRGNGKYILRDNTNERNPSLTTNKLILTLEKHIPNSSTEMIKRLALQHALLAEDAHIKNFSILHHNNKEKTITLAPLYDINSFISYAKGKTSNILLAVNINNKTDITEITLQDYEQLMVDLNNNGLNINIKHIKKEIQDIFTNVIKHAIILSQNPLYKNNTQIQKTTQSLLVMHEQYFNKNIHEQ